MTPDEMTREERRYITSKLFEEAQRIVVRFDAHALVRAARDGDEFTVVSELDRAFTNEHSIQTVMNRLKEAERIILARDPLKPSPIGRTVEPPRDTQCEVHHIDNCPNCFGH